MHPKWQPTQEQIDTLAAFVKPKLQSMGLDPDVEFGFFPFSFYDNFCLFTVYVQEGTLHGLWNPGNSNPDEAIYLIDGTNGPIYTVNKAAPIKLTPENVADYARFFYSMVHGRHGPFIIVEKAEYIPWLATATDADKQEVDKVIRPLLVGVGHDNCFLLHAMVLFKDGLFKADIHIDDAGIVELRDEHLLFQKLPVYTEHPAAA